MDGWYYKVFDSDFGPVTFDELVELAKNHTLSRDDQVRFGETGPWRRAGSIGPLMAHFPFEAVEKVITISSVSPSTDSATDSTPSATTESWDIDDLADSAPSMDDFVISESSVATKPMRSGGRPSAPAQPQTPSARRRQFDDENPQPAPAPAPMPAPRPAPAPAPKLAPAPSQAANRTDEPSRTDPRWWCMIKDKEYGPIDLPKLIEWASTGRLRRDDYVRFGLQPYVRADELPELFPKLPPQQIQDTKAELDAKTEVRPTPAPRPISRPSEAYQPAAASQSFEEPSPAVSRPTPMTSPSMSSAGFQGGSFGSARPTAPIHRIPPKSSSGSTGNLLTSPIVLGGVGVVVLGVLVFFGLQFLQSADVGRVKAIDSALAEIVELRKENEVSSADAKTAASKAAAVAKKISKELKGTKDKNSKKVQTLATKLEELTKIDLSKPCEDQKKADAAISTTKSELNKTKRALGM